VWLCMVGDVAGEVRPVRVVSWCRGWFGVDMAPGVRGCRVRRVVGGCRVSIFL
jgi:hypothetical protein